MKLDIKEVKIPFLVRQATSAAYAIAEYDLGCRPVLLCQPCVIEKGARDKKAVVWFRFEGGVVIFLQLYDLSQLQESWRGRKQQEWVVTNCDITHNVAFGKELRKVTNLWDFEKLAEIYHKFPWYHPCIMKVTEIKGCVGIFWDNASQEGHVEVDPECNQSEHAHLAESVPYQILIKGSLEQAQKKADEILKSYYQE